MPGAGGFLRSDGISTSPVKLPWKTSLHFWHQGDLQSLNLRVHQPWRWALQNPFRKTRILPNSVEKRSLYSLQLQEQRALNSVLWAIRNWRLALAFLDRDGDSTGRTSAVLKKMPWRNALHLFWTLKHRTRFCYNACIDAVSKAPQQALGLLTMMRQEGLQPDSATWSSCIYASRKSWRRALGLVTQVRRQLRWDLEHFGPDVKGNESLLGASNAALSSCSLAKRWQNAVDVLTHLGRASIEANDISHMTLMGSFGGQGVMVCSWQLLLRYFSTTNVAGDWATNAAALSTAAVAMARQKEWARALSLLDTTKPFRLDPFALGVVMEVCLELQKVAPYLCKELQELGVASLEQRKHVQNSREIWGDGTEGL